MLSFAENSQQLIAIVSGCLALFSVYEAITRSRENTTAVAERKKAPHKVAPALILAFISTIVFVATFTKAF